MIKIMIAIAIMILLVLFASVVKYFIDGKKLQKKEVMDTLLKESERGIHAIEHNNTSPTIEDCIVGAKSVLEKKRIDFSLEQIVNNSYLREKNGK